jgi:hypothetical protein
MVGEFPFELGDFGAENELTAVENPGDGGINLRLDAQVLHFQIEERYFNGFHQCLPCMSAIPKSKCQQGTQTTSATAYQRNVSAFKAPFGFTGAISLRKWRPFNVCVLLLR